MKMAVFWDVAPCSLVDIGRRFRGAYCLHHQGDYTAQHPIFKFNLLCTKCFKCPAVYLVFSITFVKENSFLETISFHLKVKNQTLGVTGRGRRIRIDQLTRAQRFGYQSIALPSSSDILVFIQSLLIDGGLVFRVDNQLPCVEGGHGCTKRNVDRSHD
jgi:hypothetical protein